MSLINRLKTAYKEGESEARGTEEISKILYKKGDVGQLNPAEKQRISILMSESAERNILYNGGSSKLERSFYNRGIRKGKTNSYR